MSSVVKKNGYVKLYFLSAILSTSLLGCQMFPNSNAKSAGHQPIMHKHHDKNTINNVSGIYISPDYKPVNNHYEGLVIDISSSRLLMPAKEIQIKISTQGNTVPACSYHASATLMGQDALHGIIYTIPVQSLDVQKDNEKLVFFRFKDNILSIDSNVPNELSKYCAGDTSLKGDYRKLR